MNTIFCFMPLWCADLLRSCFLDVFTMCSVCSSFRVSTHSSMSSMSTHLRRRSLITWPCPLWRMCCRERMVRFVRHKTHTHTHTHTHTNENPLSLVNRSVFPEQKNSSSFAVVCTLANFHTVLLFDNRVHVGKIVFFKRRIIFWFFQHCSLRTVSHHLERPTQWLDRLRIKEFCRVVSMYCSTASVNCRLANM